MNWSRSRIHRVKRVVAVTKAMLKADAEEQRRAMTQRMLRHSANNPLNQPRPVRSNGDSNAAARLSFSKTIQIARKHPAHKGCRNERRYTPQDMLHKLISTVR